MPRLAISKPPDYHHIRNLFTQMSEIYPTDLSFQLRINFVKSISEEILKDGFRQMSHRSMDDNPLNTFISHDSTQIYNCTVEFIFVEAKLTKISIILEITNG